MASRKLSGTNEKKSDDSLSSSTLGIVVDEASNSDSLDEDSNSQPRQSRSITTDDEQPSHRLRKQKKIVKSHRLIEKRRRDRMNGSLADLLNIIPHRKPESHRRIEKTEIIEMAVKYVRNLKSSNPKTSEKHNFDQKSNSKLDTYRCAYQNGIYDTYEFIEKHSDNDELLTNLIEYIKDKKTELKNLTVAPEKKTKFSPSNKPSHANCDNLCAISAMNTSNDHENILQFSIDDEQSPKNSQVPIFVLHPSGTHYIPMSIDASIVSHAFNTKSNLSKTNEQLQCHPVSIPVNFNPVSTLSDSYELDIQNINVLATIHQTSVRPN